MSFTELHSNWEPISAPTERVLKALHSCKFAMKLVCCDDISSVRFFGRRKISKRYGSVVHAYLGAESLLPSTDEADAFQSKRVARTGTRVPHVLRISGYTKIGNRVVRAISINVIQMASRPFAMHVEPCKPVGWISLAVNYYSDVAVVAARSRELSHIFRAMLAPSKSARQFIIVQRI